MNIFALHSDPKLAAQMHLDRHVVKMIIEYAQLLSTAHRLHDGRLEERLTPDGRRKKFWLLGSERLTVKDFEVKLTNDDDANAQLVIVQKLVIENPMCYSLSHQNHPCAVWARQTDANYRWLFELFAETSAEYTHRYGKVHKTWTDVGEFLSHPPKNIRSGPLTPLAQAMGDEFKVKDDAIAAYRNYYLGAKASFARWTNRQAPAWFAANFPGFNSATFERASELGDGKNSRAVRNARGADAASSALPSANVRAASARRNGSTHRGAVAAHG